jgi:hypothetical protein
MFTSNPNALSNENITFAVIYRWRLHAGREADFVATWTKISKALYEMHGSFGSRLHKGPDNIWYSYAHWPSAEARSAAFCGPNVDPEASALQKACVAEFFPEIVLEPISDLLTFEQSPKYLSKPK